jgi:glutathione synthase/RimK-type ligase-like ATP-grasp enzyme
MATNVLQHAKIDPEFSLGHSLHAALTRHGKSPWSQAREIGRLRFGPNKLRPDEYYYYGLYDDRRFTSADKARFLGRHAQDRIIRQCNAGQWWFIAHDKLVFYALIAGLGLPIPETRALYHGGDRFAAVPVLARPEALAAHLRSAMPYPFFGKPVAGIRSVGVAAVKSYDPSGDAVVLTGGKTVGVDGFVRELEPYREQGYLFQEVLRPHPDLAVLCGPRVATVRLVVLLEESGPAILHALWKVPVGDNPADNFWRPGNLLAGLDAETGQVRRVIQGTGSDQVELERHPDTDQPLVGATLPDWPLLTGLCLEAARAFPGLRMQAWDIALTDRGPVLVEVNIGGDFNLPQLAHATGLMDERFRAFVDRCANRSG